MTAIGDGVACHRIAVVCRRKPSHLVADHSDRFDWDGSIEAVSADPAASSQERSGDHVGGLYAGVGLLAVRSSTWRAC
ncbi:MAG TPA: hypothetical protein VGK58_23550 [Lacipirellulaceae bacterium]